jgi:UDP-3-O-[3-hydroxymyristoyl] N-acetylglucosamine deacetylase
MSTTHPIVRQRTLKSPIHCRGVGLHSGTEVSLRLEPAAPGTGIVFRRVDRPASEAEIPALWDRVVDTRLCTRIANEAGTSVATIEHLMAAFAGSQIDNAVVAIDGPEVPIMDGSAAPFVFLIECAGAAEQASPRRAIRVLKPVVVTDGPLSLSIEPREAGFGVDFEIEFDSPAITEKRGAVQLVNGNFKAEISRARTFGFLQDVDRLRAAGYARGGSLDNAVVVSGDRVLNEEGLRFPDEFVRHKMLDCIGDLYLAGAPLIAQVRGVRTGHHFNNLALRRLFADESAWRWDVMTEADRAHTPARKLALSA